MGVEGWWGCVPEMPLYHVCCIPWFCLHFSCSEFLFTNCFCTPSFMFLYSKFYFVFFLCSSAEYAFHIPNTYGTWSGHWFWWQACFPYNTTTPHTLDHQLLCRRSHDLTSPLSTPLKEVNGSVLLPFTNYPLLTPISLTSRIGMSTIINQSWARDNVLASQQQQRDNVIVPQGPVRDQKKIEK